jgi:hypothetical protein
VGGVQGWKKYNSRQTCLGIPLHPQMNFTGMTPHAVTSHDMHCVVTTLMITTSVKVMSSGRTDQKGLASAHMLYPFPKYVPLISKSYKCCPEYPDLTRADIRHPDVKHEIHPVDVWILFGLVTRVSPDEI